MACEPPKLSGVMSFDKLSDPLVLALFGLVLSLALVLLLRKKQSESHIQQASQGGTINHHQDARVVVTVTVGRRE